jgi:hypothetical protein
MKTKPLSVFIGDLFETNKVDKYSLGKYKNYDFNENDHLIIDETNSNVVGYLKIVEQKSPKNVFASTEGGFITFHEDVVELRLKTIELPHNLLTQEFLRKLLFVIQYNTMFFYKKTKMILWFEHKRLYQECPITSCGNNSEPYTFFPSSMAQLIWEAIP